MRRWNTRRPTKAPLGNQDRSGDAAQEWRTRLGQHRPEKWIGDMLTISEAQRRTELFLTGQMLEALRGVEYGLPALIPSCTDVDLAEIARARVEIRHVRGASDATYLINAFGEELLMQLQLNVHRLVVVYRVPALDALDASSLAVRLERWRIGAEHAGWKFGWRDSPIADDPGRRFVETYWYSFAGPVFSKIRR